MSDPFSSVTCGSFVLRIGMGWLAPQSTARLSSGPRDKRRGRCALIWTVGPGVGGEERHEEGWRCGGFWRLALGFWVQGS